MRIRSGGSIDRPVQDGRRAGTPLRSGNNNSLRSESDRSGPNGRRRSASRLSSDGGRRQRRSNGEGAERDRVARKSRDRDDRSGGSGWTGSRGVGRSKSRGVLGSGGLRGRLLLWRLTGLSGGGSVRLGSVCGLVLAFGFRGGFLGLLQIVLFRFRRLVKFSSFFGLRERIPSYQNLLQ